MDVMKVRNELRRMRKGDLIELVSGQRIAKCPIGGQICSYYFEYKSFNFCVSEIFGEGCIYEKARGREHLLRRERREEFKVYYRDEITHSITFLGKIIERRVEERRDNLSDLLTKASQEFSSLVPNPSSIFLLGPSLE